MSNGRIYKPEDKFSMISNSLLRDETVPYKARGLYATMYSYLSLDGFTLYKSYLAKHCPEGEKAFESTWKSLKKSGYMIMHKMKDEKGSYYYEYELLNEKTHTPKKEVVDNGVGGKRGSINKTLNNKTLNNKSKNKNEKKPNWDNFDQREYKEEDLEKFYFNPTE